jgi:uncharacterized protein with GYD domain
MATYIMLMRLTQQGTQNLKKLPDLADLQKAGFGPLMNVEIKHVYLTMGQYDAVTIVEAPNDEAVAKFVLNVAGIGNVRTETFRAFTEDEARKLMEGTA